MTAPQSSGNEAIRADIGQDATHPKKDPMRRIGSRAKHVSLSLTAMPHASEFLFGKLPIIGFRGCGIAPVEFQSASA
jgi:hypothetical protein